TPRTATSSTTPTAPSLRWADPPRVERSTHSPGTPNDGRSTTTQNRAGHGREHQLHRPDPHARRPARLRGVPPTPLRRAVLRADHGRDAARGQHERHRPTDRVPRGLGRTAGPVQRARRHPPAGGAGMTRGRPAPELVLLGADIGVYAIARAFHEEYGTIATAICRTAAGPIKGSKIIEAIPLGEGAEDGEIIDALLHLAGQRPNARPHLMANADKLIRL